MLQHIDLVTGAQGFLNLDHTFHTSSGTSSTNVKTARYSGRYHVKPDLRDEHLPHTTIQGPAGY